MSQITAEPVHPPAASSALPDRLTLAAFLLMVLFSGGASVAIRFTYAEMPPFWSAGLRFALGALFFWGWAWVTRAPLPRGRALWGTVLNGTLGIGFSFALIYYGLVETPASLFQTIAALVPLMTVFLASLHGLELIHRRGVAGALLTVVGISIAVGGLQVQPVSTWRILAILAGVACLTEAGVVAKLLPRVQPVAFNAISMTVGALILLTLSWLAGETAVLPTKAVTWLAFGYLVIFVSIAVFRMFLFVLARWTITGVSYMFVLNPLVTIALASTLAGERITWQLILGGTLVALGVWVGALLKTGKG